MQEKDYRKEKDSSLEKKEKGIMPILGEFISFLKGLF